MGILDVIEVWWYSVGAIMDSSGGITHFERSPGDRLNPSCAMNVRRNGREADLVVWDSGEAEFAVKDTDGSVSQNHFDDIRNIRDLGAVLSRVIAIAVSDAR